MPIHVDLSGLRRCVEEMGAVPSDFTLTIDLGGVEPIDVELGGRGIEVDIRELDTEYGVLSYKGRQVLLYIPDHGNHIEAAIRNSEKGKRFHVAECSTIQSMRTKNRFERYVATNNLSGVFQIHGKDMFGRHMEAEIELCVCKNCLKHLNYKDYRNRIMTHRNEIFRDFSIEEFFSVYSSLFERLPQGFAKEDEGYPDNWTEISARYRAKKGFRCEKCKVDLSQHKRLLHTHHINGVKSHNTDDNLIALCVDCHRKEPFHEHLFVRREDSRLIERLRQEQGLGDVDGWEDAFELADPALHGLLHELQHRGYSPPQVGYELLDNSGRIRAQLELAWPQKRLGVVILPKAKKAAEGLGWKVMNHAEALECDW